MNSMQVKLAKHPAAGRPLHRLRMSWFVGSQFELVGHPAELGKRTRLHFAHQPAAVNLYRSFSNTQVACNLLAKAAADDLNHDIALPGTQRCEALRESDQDLPVLPRGTVTSEAEVNGVEKGLIAERFGEKLDSPAFHRLHGHGDVAVSGDENDRKLPVGYRELALKIEAALAGQTHVENQAGGAIGRIRFEKVGNGRKELTFDTDRPQQASNRRTKVGIVVHNQDGGICVVHRYDPRSRIPGVSA